ncbi:cytochrome c [Pseudomonas sp. RIT-PI-AD]|uniref:cytochrome c n=1 Tax=Pseudomonas sp. RIT-PI-AD TaxID=3035294 RepID=UPI0021D8E446|nr:cytochrome c [Pseudomonas sp. RIT-PI-AD]
MRGLLIALLSLGLLPASAADLVIERPQATRTLHSAELLADPRTVTLEVADDVSYKRPMRYRAIPLAVLLEGLKPGDQLQAVALDGFAAELDAAPLLNERGSRAWLAIEDPAQPWPPLGQGKPSAGPFYLVWTDPKASRIVPEQWPFQLSRLRYLAPLAQRFPALLPAADADAEVREGFAQFRKNCLACHRLNGAGDAEFGPDLNQPFNPTEYFAGDFLRRYIRDPQSLRRWPQAKMPAFGEGILSEPELSQLIAYLRHMASRKR